MVMMIAGIIIGVASIALIVAVSVNIYPLEEQKLALARQTSCPRSRWAARSEQTTKANATTRAVIAEIQRAGKATLAAIAQQLEARGVRTLLAGSTWTPCRSRGCWRKWLRVGSWDTANAEPASGALAPWGAAHRKPTSCASAAWEDCDLAHGLGGQPLHIDHYVS